MYYSFDRIKELLTEVKTHRLWRVREDGTGNYMLADKFKISDMSIIDGLLYYINGKDLEIYSMKTVGTDARNVSPFMLIKRVGEGNI